MSLSSLVPDRPDDLERLPSVAEAFVLAPPEPGWAWAIGERSRAAGKLAAFVATAGMAAGVALWLAITIAAAAIRGLA